MAMARAVLWRRATALVTATRLRAGFCTAQSQGFAAAHEAPPPPPGQGFPPPQGQGFPPQSGDGFAAPPNHEFGSPQAGEDFSGGGDAPDAYEAEDYMEQNPYNDNYSPGGPVYDAEYSSPDSYASQEQQEPYIPPPPPPPPPPKPKFDNKNVPITLVSLGRAMQLRFQSQKEFEAMMDKAGAFGVMLPDEPGNITRELCELDPKKVYAVVDMKAALKYTKKLAAEEAERSGYPKDFMKLMNRNKYGKYDSDDD